MVETMIRLKDVRKSYRINTGDPSKKKFGRKDTEEFVVFDGVNLELNRGDVMAFLGRNGCGKSTLLKIISGIIEPDSGTVEVHGKVASILELSMGFHNDLTGRENIFLRSELYGIPRKKVSTYVDDIVEYSDLGKFIDNPVRTYSSGMRARLAFSIMVSIDAEVFLIDEALSTGDMSFSSKASEHLKNLVREGKTVIMTSHNMNTIRNTCNRAIWLDDHRVAMDGPAKDVCNAYSASINESFDETLKLAEGGSSAAQYRLAGYYHHGIRTEVDATRYRYWLEEAAKRGHVPAMSELANILMDEDPSNNLERATEMYRAAAEGGNFDARRHYARLKGDTGDDERILRDTLRMLSESGYPGDVCAYGRMLQATAVTETDKALAFETMCRAADLGSTEALFRKAMMLRNGFGTERSMDDALTCLESAALLGHPRAMTTLGDMYSDGRMVPRDQKKAFGWYLLSARTGNTRSQYIVANMLANGIGIEKDEIAADDWFRRSASSSLDDVRMYAVDALQRRRITDPALMDLLECASDSGNMRAMSKLAHMTSKGIGSRKDASKAMTLYETTAKGMGRNRTPLADVLSEGTICEPDLERSFELYMQAASNGDAYAMYSVACMYRDGRGVGEDRDLYKFYTHMAADHGNRDAMEVVMKWKRKEEKRKRSSNGQKS